MLRLLDVLGPGHGDGTKDVEHGENERNRLSAAQYIIDRAYGKAVQQTELTGKGGEDFTIQIVRFSGHDDSQTAQ